MPTPGNKVLKTDSSAAPKNRRQRKEAAKHADRIARESAEADANDLEALPETELRHVPIHEIVFGERFREKYDVEDLVESIKDKGIVQPITIDTNMGLLAGGRRLTAAKLVGLETIPALIRPASDSIEAREIELLENIEREDLTWQERTKLTKEIDDLYTQKYGVRSAGVGQGWSGRKTAELLSRSHGSVQRTLALAEGMSLIPDIASCNTENEAFKMLKKIEEGMLVKQLRKEQTDTLESSPQQSDKEFEEHISSLDKSKQLELIQARMRTQRLEQAEGNFRVGDCLLELVELTELYTKQESAIRFIECDPPFGISLAEQKKRTNKDAPNIIDDYVEVEEDDYVVFLEEVAQRTFDIANKNCWMVFWYGPTWTIEVRIALENAGWAVDHIPAIWVKGEEESEGSGQTGSPERYLARATEFFYVCRKGLPLLAKEGRTNVFSHKPTPPSKKYHPTQKPLELYNAIYETFTFPGSVTCIPFLGSGAALRSAYLNGLLGFGWDLNEKNKDRFLIAVEDDLNSELEKMLDE